MGETTEGPVGSITNEGLTIELPRVQIDPKSADTIGRIRSSGTGLTDPADGPSNPDSDKLVTEVGGRLDADINNAQNDTSPTATVPKKDKTRRTEEESELGIYEDTAECDDLSDYEAEMTRVKKQVEKNKENEKPADEKQTELKTADDAIVDKFESDGNKITFDKTADQQSERPPKSSQSFSIKDLQRMSGYTRGKTPMSMLTDFSETRSRNASRLALESREAMFQKAMTLLSARCTSVHHEASQTGSKDQSYGQYLLIKQEKPLPMPPLKAWRGYNGNVYFEPINILPMKSSRSSRENEGPMTIKSAPSRTQTNKKRALSDQQAGDSRTNSQQTNKSSQGSVPPGTRQMVLMDKQAVLTRFNEHLQEDVVWLEGQENTGSLAIKPRQNRERSQTALLNKKLCKGSVAHKLHVENEAKRQPALTVSGGKFVPPASLSPLLRAQTQYSLSSHRLTTNSPDLFHLNQDNKLPPLEQIRASLKHEQAIPRPKTYTRPVTITNERKPLVKYSPDVLAKFNQQANIC